MAWTQLPTQLEVRAEVNALRQQRPDLGWSDVVADVAERLIGLWRRAKCPVAMDSQNTSRRIFELAGKSPETTTSDEDQRLFDLSLGNPEMAISTSAEAGSTNYNMSFLLDQSGPRKMHLDLDGDGGAWITVKDEEDPLRVTVTHPHPPDKRAEELQRLYDRALDDLRKANEDIAGLKKLSSRANHEQKVQELQNENVQLKTVYSTTLDTIQKVLKELRQSSSRSRWKETSEKIRLWLEETAEELEDGCFLDLPDRTSCDKDNMMETFADRPSDDDECQAGSQGRKRRRKRVKEPPLDYPCHACSREFGTFKQLDEHLGQAGVCSPSVEFSSRVCDVCLCVVTNSRYDDHLKLHEQSLKLDKPTECPACNEVIAKLADLNKHFLHVHDESRLCCLQCKKVFKASRLSDHWKKSHRCEELLCPICGKKFTLKYSYDSHLQDHEGRRQRSQVVCELCGKHVVGANALISHKSAQHGLEKSFECDDCGKKFSLLNRLKRHRINHTDLKPFKCPLCDYTTNRRTNVPLHVKQKHKQVCSYNDVVVIENQMEEYEKMFPNASARIKAMMPENVGL